MSRSAQTQTTPQESAVPPITPRQLAFIAAVRQCERIAERVEQIAKVRNLDLKRGPKLPKRLTQITTEQLALCQQLIEGGASPATAALRAFHIHPVTFKKWMEEGASPEGSPVHQALFFAIREAAASARIIAEQRVFVEDPAHWLNGPAGRTQENEPGWHDDARSQNEGRPPARSLEVVITFSPRGAEHKVIDVTNGREEVSE